ncbi:hypothetical protein ACFLTA_03495 [Bacteroidota bacterium]
MILFLLILLAVNCKRKSDSDINEGKIKFSITYAQSKVGGYSTSVLPKEMVMEFSENMVKNSIEGGLGFFSLVHVSDLRHDQHTTWLKFIDKKYIYTGERRETPCCFGMLEGMELEFTDSTKQIAGLNSIKVVANFPDNTMTPFDIWYTEELGLNNPNGNTPFHDIPGVLLEFNTFMGNANMHMIATEFNIQSIPQKQFQSPKNFRPVTKTEMETILTALMN